MSNEGNVIDELYAQVLLFRDLVNEPKVGFRIRQDRSRWGKICASMDVIEDTCLAINSLPALSGERPDKGFLYLASYGLLQSLFVQQNAVANLCKALDFPFDRTDETLKRVKNIRNDSIGHPTDRSNGSVHGISQATLSLAGFQMLSETQQGEMIFTDINLAELIKQQGAVLQSIMTGLIMDIEQRDKRDREKCKSKKLKSVFPKNIGYILGKIIDSTVTDDRLEIGLASLMTIRESLSHFKATLEERGLGVDAYLGVRDVFKCIEFPQDRLEMFFRDGILPGESHESSQEAVYIFARYYRERVLEILEMAQSIDDDFATDT